MDIDEIQRSEPNHLDGQPQPVNIATTTDLPPQLPAINNCTTTQQVITATITRGKLALPIVIVEVLGPIRSMRVNVLLDTGSDTTLCTEHLIDQQSLLSKPHITSLATRTSSHTLSKCHLTDITIHSLCDQQIHILEEVTSCDVVPVSAKCRASAVEVSEWKHLEQYEFIYHDKHTINIVIGQDNYLLITAEDIKPGKTAREPGEVQTSLGWYVAGRIEGAPVPPTLLLMDNRIIPPFSFHSNF